MINKIIKIVIKMMLIFLIFQTLSTRVVTAFGLGDIIDQGDKFIQQGKAEEQQTGGIDTEKLGNINADIYRILVGIGVIAAVIIGGILGIQLMWGSIEQQVKAKEMLMPYAIGCIVVFGAFGIWRIAVLIGNGLQSNNNIQSLNTSIIEGKVELSSITNSELKELFYENQISIKISNSMSKNHNAAKTLEEAVRRLDDYSEKIYNECKSRGLLKEDGINLK